MLRDALALLAAAAREVGPAALEGYHQLYYRLASEGCAGLGAWLWDALRYTETPYGKLAGPEVGEGELEQAARRAGRRRRAHRRRVQRNRFGQDDGGRDLQNHNR